MKNNKALVMVDRLKIGDFVVDGGIELSPPDPVYRAWRIVAKLRPVGLGYKDGDVVEVRFKFGEDTYSGTCIVRKNDTKEVELEGIGGLNKI